MTPKISKRLIAISIFAMLVLGCSLVDPPEANDGAVIVRLVRNSAGGDGKSHDQLQAALGVADSITVDVYPPGTSDVPEVSEGIAVPPGTDTVLVDLSVVAEANKRVAVRLFSGGSLAFFGVDEDVDVLSGQNTNVQILAVRFEMGAITTTPDRIWEDEPFSLSWPRVESADGYYLQVSLLPDFSIVAWDTLTPDTFLAGALPNGDYYIRIAAQNIYTDSEWGAAQIRVAGDPLVTGMSIDAVLRGYRADFEVYGIDLDHPSTSVSVFGQPCTIIGTPKPDTLMVRLTPGANALADHVTVSNQFGNDDSNGYLRVMNIAYVMGDPNGGGDLTTASYYKTKIDGYGDMIHNSAVFILPYTIIGSGALDLSIFDMIIIGYDTGTNTIDWGGGDPIGKNRAQEIKGAEAAVLGLGRGGAAYFGLAGLNIGIDECVLGPADDIWVVDPAAEIYNVPNPISVRSLVLYASSLGPIRLAVASPPNGVDRLASESIISNNYPFVNEPVSVTDGKVNNFLWGFEGDPWDMTITGGDVFQNVIKFVYDDATKSVIVGP